MIEPHTREMFEALYQAFNARDADAVLGRMARDVEWPNGWEGGYVHGVDAVRDYWSRQWDQIDPTVTPTDIAVMPDGRVEVTVHQVIRDRDGTLLADGVVRHTYQLDDGLIVSMEITE